jgi:hypothetical protein
MRSGALTAAINQAAETGVLCGSNTAVDEAPSGRAGAEPVRASGMRRNGEEGRPSRADAYETVAVMMRTLLRVGRTGPT